MKYKQITIKVKHEDADVASYAMIECGSEGASIVDGTDVKEVINSSKNWDYYDSSLNDVDTTYAFVTGCYDINFDSEILSDLLETYIGKRLELNVSVCDSLDWENEWKKYYKPLDFGKIVVIPKWLEYNTNKPYVLIDPGMAFGTGNHETTGMCIKLLGEITNLNDANVLDVGCGSGILGISALKLGAKNCTLIDIDPQAVEATSSNLTLNNLTADVIEGDLAEKYKGVADVVLANLTADILLRLRDSLPKVTKQGSLIIMSGIINARANDVINGYINDNSGEFSLVTNLREGEWQAIMIRKN
ncbi:MAG: 50S ribosomal protein L11 methyltransferase [Clostridia bacterium]|nr:50S ribosomal protein L11 methyltransferase [Clostridia bacterium]